MAKSKKPKVIEGVRQPELRAVQLVAINLIDGNTGLGMLSVDGRVFTYNGTGWVRLSMLEVTDDTQV